MKDGGFGVSLIDRHVGVIVGRGNRTLDWEDAATELIGDRPLFGRNGKHEYFFPFLILFFVLFLLRSCFPSSLSNKETGKRQIK